MDRPFVVVLAAASADGRIASGPNKTMWEDMADSEAATPAGGEVWRKVEGEVKRIHRPQVDMLGSNSLAKEGEPLEPLPPYAGDPAPLYEDFLPEAVVQRPGHAGWLVVVDGRGRLRSGFKGEPGSGWHMLHITARHAPPEYVAFLRAQGIPYLVAGAGPVDLPAALGKLQAKLGVSTVLTTAGGKLGGALLRAGLVDEVNILVRPVAIGGFTTPCLFDSPDPEPGQRPARLELLHVQPEPAGHLWLRYRVVKD